MSIALGGLAVFQVLHIRELLSIRQRQFDANVMQSLHETAASLENRESAQLIAENMFSTRLDSLRAATSLLNDSLDVMVQSIQAPRFKIKMPKHSFSYRFRQDSMGFSQHFEINGETEQALEKELENGMKVQNEAVQLQMNK